MADQSTSLDEKDDVELQVGGDSSNTRRAHNERRSERRGNTTRLVSEINNEVKF